MFWQLRLICLLLFIFPKTSIAVEFNRTIDDTLGDEVTGKRPIYLPQTVGVWQDSGCKGCLLQPDGILAFNGTWTAATYNPTLTSMSVELAFKGTAIYIFFILANIVEKGLPAETACNFTLDGQSAGSFKHVPAPTNEFLYDSLVFSQSNLSNVDHQLSISTSGLDHNVWVNFDYAIYTTDDIPPRPSSLSPPTNPSTSSPSPSSTLSMPPAPPGSSEKPGPSQTAAIVGGVMGAFTGLFVFLLVFLLWRRRKRHAEQDVEFPTTLPPILPGYHYNDSNAQFVTPFVNPYTVRQDSGFIQNGTIYSPPIYSEAPRSTVDPSTMYANAYSLDTPPEHGLTGPITKSSLPSGGNRAPGNTGMGSESNPISRVTLGPSQQSQQSHTTEVVRRARQMEINRQMHALKEEMGGLKTGFHMVKTRRALASSGGRSEVEISDMREQMRMMREQIEYLQAQQQSAWAQGLSDEPPPDYSARHTSTLR